MGAEMKRQNEQFQEDFDKIFAKGTWTKDEIAMMKDLKKLIYYNKVICAMDEGGEYPGSEHMPDMSYARGNQRHNPMNGQFMSNGSGIYYPDYPMMNGNRYYDMNSSGRRYYDDEKKNALHKLHHMMDMEENPEKKNALKIAINELEEHK